MPSARSAHSGSQPSVPIMGGLAIHRHTCCMGVDPGIASHSVVAAEQGCYEASRAAALSGVPISTVYHWARTGVVVPSVSPIREKLWSYADLMALRVVSWLRQAKESSDGQVVPASPMRQVRQALAYLDTRRI